MSSRCLRHRRHSRQPSTPEVRGELFEPIPHQHSVEEHDPDPADHSSRQQRTFHVDATTQDVDTASQDTENINDVSISDPVQVADDDKKIVHDESTTKMEQVVAELKDEIDKEHDEIETEIKNEA